MKWRIASSLLIVCLFSSLCVSYEYDLSELSWKIACVDNVPVDGCILSNSTAWLDSNYTQIPFTNSSLYTSWLPAAVPGTVLANLVKNNIYPDPYYGLNNELIPDLYNVPQEFYTFWYYTSFSLLPNPNDNYFLVLRGINYAAEVYINGVKLNNNTLEGMFLRHTLPLSYYHLNLTVNPGTQELPILVTPPYPPGNATTGQCGDGTLAKSVTCQYMAGWDWVQPMRDRSTGIWDKIYIVKTGSAKINNYHFQPMVNGIRTPFTSNQPDATASLQVSVENLKSTSNSIDVSFSLMYETTVAAQYTTSVTLNGGEKSKVTFNNIQIANPKLWWPNVYGEQPLYNLTISLTDSSSNFLLDSQSMMVGIRNISSNIDPETGGRQFFVNGQRIFVRGGNWIGLDAMMRNLTLKNYETYVGMHAEMGFNMIRVWGGGVTERPEFYEACDKFGILVWQEFWITGDCNGAWDDPVKKESQNRRKSYPNSHLLFQYSAQDVILMLRNHPSLCLWVGGNEWQPPMDLNATLTNLVSELDPNRLYLPSSLSGGIGPHDGPYDIKEPIWFFRWKDENAFNPEMGSVGVPVVETMHEFIPEAQMHPFGERNVVWNYHKYIPYHHHAPSQIDSYGVPETISDFCTRAQLVNYVQYKALLEGRQQHMWKWYTGILVWKSQNPWAGLRGQFYDWYGDQTASFYGVKSANEAVHIQYNLHNDGVYIINHALSNITDLRATAIQHLISPTGDVISSVDSFCNTTVPFIDSNAIFFTNCTAPALDVGSIAFLELNLANAFTNEEISSNIYWISGSRERAIGQFSILQNLKPANFDYTYQYQNLTDPHSGESLVVASLSFTNTEANAVAFFLRLQVLNKKKVRILPVSYSDNYFTLLPGRSKSVTVSFVQPKEEWNIYISSWNQPSVVLLLK